MTDDKELDNLRAIRNKYEGLIKAFNQAAETYPSSHPMPAAVQAWWTQFYNAIRDYGGVRHET